MGEGGEGSCGSLIWDKLNHLETSLDFIRTARCLGFPRRTWNQKLAKYSEKAHFILTVGPHIADYIEAILRFGQIGQAGTFFTSALVTQPSI